MIKGFFKVRRSEDKIALKLKGTFNAENIQWINHVLTNRTFFRSQYIELDMSEAEDITRRSLGMLFNALNTLKERGVSVRVIGTINLPF